MMRWFSEIDDGLARGGAAGDAALLTISEMAERFGVTMRTLRFYEEKGLIAPTRIGSRRFYSKVECHRLEVILKGKALGLPVDVIGDFVEAVESGDSDGERAIRVRELCEAQLAELTSQRDRIEGHIAEVERTLNELASLFE